MKPTLTERDNLVQALVAARVSACVKQVEIARRARLSRAYIAQVESGHCFPTARILWAYAQTCGMDSDALCRVWGYIPEDLREWLADNPSLWGRVRVAIQKIVSDC